MGPEFSEAEIGQYFDSAGARYRKLEDGALARETARLISEGNVVGWFQGRMRKTPNRVSGIVA